MNISIGIAHTSSETTAAVQKTNDTQQDRQETARVHHQQIDQTPVGGDQEVTKTDERERHKKKEPRPTTSKTKCFATDLTSDKLEPRNIKHANKQNVCRIYLQTIRFLGLYL